MQKTTETRLTYEALVDALCHSLAQRQGAPDSLWQQIRTEQALAELAETDASLTSLDMDE